MFKSRHFTLWFIALALLVTSILPHHVSAAGIAYQQYKWLVTFDFIAPNGAPTDDGVLTIIIRTYYTDGTFKDDVTTQPVACSPSVQGTVTIANGAATFQNGGYLDCDLPSIRNAIRAVAPSAIITDYWDPFWVQATNTINTAAGTADNPVVWHPDLEFSLPYKSNLNQANISIDTDAYNALLSPAFTPVANQTVLVNQRNWWHEQQQHYCTAQFRHNGTTLLDATYNCPRPKTAMYFSTNPSDLYIGYNDSTHATFNGTILDIKIDPPQWGVID